MHCQLAFLWWLEKQDKVHTPSSEQYCIQVHQDELSQFFKATWSLFSTEEWGMHC